MAIFNSGLISKSFSELTMLIPPCFLFLLERLYKLQVIIEKTLCPSLLHGKIYLSWVLKWQASGTFIHSTTPYCMHKQICRWWGLEVRIYFVFILHFSFDTITPINTHTNLSSVPSAVSAKLYYCEWECYFSLCWHPASDSTVCRPPVKY